MFDDDGDVIARAARHLRRPVDVDAGLGDRVMARVLSLPRRSPRRRSRLVAAIGALAAAAGLVGLALARRPVDTAGPGRPARVRFELIAPGASRVAVVGDFNDWHAAGIPLRRAPSGDRWVATVVLRPGRYNYAFLVDGTRWLPDPAAPWTAADDFGRPNSVVTVGASSL